jgi:hypothetical protein
MKTTVDLEDYLDAEVMDVDGKLTGSLRCFWADEEGAPIFVGIKTPWNKDDTVIVPVDLVEPNEYHSCVVIRATQEQLRDAPTLSCDESLPVELEDQAYQHFEITPPKRRARLQINQAAAKNKLHGR